MDTPIMKLDAGSDEMFEGYNCPAKGIGFRETAEQLASLSKMTNITIQTLFSKGTGGNSGPAHVNKWLRQIKKISPSSVQIYTLSRPSPTRALLPLERDELLEIQDLLEKEQIRAEVFR